MFFVIVVIDLQKKPNSIRCIDGDNAVGNPIVGVTKMGFVVAFYRDLLA